MTAQQQAQQNIIAALGLDANSSNWSYDERNAYNTQLQQWITSNPDSVTAGALAAANGDLNYTALSDTGFVSSLSDFSSALEDNVVNAFDDIGGVGRGILSTLSLSAYLIPIAAIAAVVILLFALSKKTGATAS